MLLPPAAVTPGRARSRASVASIRRVRSSDASKPPGTRMPIVSTFSGE